MEITSLRKIFNVVYSLIQNILKSLVYQLVKIENFHLLVKYLYSILDKISALKFYYIKFGKHETTMNKSFTWYSSISVVCFGLDNEALEVQHVSGLNKTHMRRYHMLVWEPEFYYLLHNVQHSVMLM